ncbi:hypothetical protein BBP40_003380 [Aspergillus hancockii]|nr:hypothetical protein BBP40_003380 [Aspergillus hancockii]
MTDGCAEHGELLNTAAYAFAPAVLVTPLGALSVLISALLAAYFLNENVQVLGRLGCATCLLGSVLLVLHAPGDRDIQTIDEILHLAIQPFFLLYCLFVTAFSSYMIYKVAPTQGRANPLVYISICSTVGSISVMSVKAFGIAVKLTFAGDNQFTHASTYVFSLVLVVTTLTQMNYLNKAMSEFPASLVNAMYYVAFTTCTLTASIIFYQGLNTSNWTSIISMMCGFLLNFIGISLLTLSKTAPESVRELRMRSLDLSHGRYDHVRTSSVDSRFSRGHELRRQPSDSLGHKARFFHDSFVPTGGLLLRAGSRYEHPALPERNPHASIVSLMSADVTTIFAYAVREVSA